MTMTQPPDQPPPLGDPVARIHRTELEQLHLLSDDTTLPAHARADLTDYLSRYYAAQALCADMNAARSHAQAALRDEQQRGPERLLAALAAGPVPLPAVDTQLAELRAAVELAEDRAWNADRALGLIMSHLERGVFRTHADQLLVWVAQQRTQTPASEQVSPAVRRVYDQISHRCRAIFPADACLSEDGTLTQPLEQSLTLGPNRLHLWAWAAISAGQYAYRTRGNLQLVRLTADWQEQPQPLEQPPQPTSKRNRALAVSRS